MAKKTIKKAQRVLTASKQKVVIKTTSVKKKEVPKLKKEEIKAKMIGKNLVVMISGKKFVKPNISDKDLKSIQVKIGIFNKTNKKDKKEEILKFFESVEKKKEDLNKIKAKGIKNVIKAVKKAAPKKKHPEVKETLEEVVKEVPKEEIAKVVESVQEHKEQPKVISNVGVTRRGEY